jgi:SAM-dependent methyltransferase
MPIHQSDIVRRYYEKNTKWFIRLGGAKTHAIHRAVWANGVTTFNQAIHYVHSVITAWVQHTQLSVIGKNSIINILDLGCGLGGGLFYLAQHSGMPMRSVGVTISPTQARIAQNYAREHQLTANVSFVEADFLHVPLAGKWHLIYSIEAFCHATHPTPYLDEVNRLLNVDGYFILCDDFLSDNALHTANNVEWLRAYEYGWRVPNIHTVRNLLAMTDNMGLELVENTDLTPYLRLRTLPRFLSNLLIPFSRLVSNSNEIVISMLGSIALQHCLKMGLIQYRYLVFKKR